MIKCVYPTTATKLGVIAATYRSGDRSIFGSCPTTCPLLPIHHRAESTNQLDHDYLAIERQAVPRKGLAWSYTHWKPREEFRNLWPDQSTLNISADTQTEAIVYHNAGFDTTYVAPATDTQWPRRIDDVLFVRCPAEINKTISCQTCGHGRPLCARKNRAYVIVFTAHGAQKQRITDKTGGCYAANFPCSRQWTATRNGTGPTTWDETQDLDRLLAWTASLPPGTLLRHRIAGDLGCAPLSPPV